jgi:hypothetical protein
LHPKWFNDHDEPLSLFCQLSRNWAQKVTGKLQTVQKPENVLYKSPPKCDSEPFDASGRA